MKNRIVIAASLLLLASLLTACTVSVIGGIGDPLCEGRRKAQRLIVEKIMLCRSRLDHQFDCGLICTLFAASEQSQSNTQS